MPGNVAYRNDVLHCEDVPLPSLAGEHGTPLYVYSRRSMLDRLASLAAAFEPLDPLLAYSVKANGNLSILRLLADAGAGADIVSGGELHRAERAGVPADRIVFSGVGKTREELEAALDAGILCLNVESEGELRLLSQVARGAGRDAPFALRINPDIESPTPHPYTRTGHRTTKFGIEHDRAVELYRLALELGGLDPVGIDVHIGSQITDPEPYRLSLSRLLELVDALEGHGIALRHVDLGGGFGVAHEGQEAPDATAFAAGIVPLMEGRDLGLILEPGRYVVGHAGVLLTRVLYVKRTGGKTFVVTDAGMNDLLRPSHYASFHPVTPVERVPGRARAAVDVVGPICESGGFLALDRELPLPEPGALLAIQVAGAYGFTMASTYNARPRPAEVLVNGGRVRLIRRRETYEDLVRGEEELLA